MNIFLKNGYVDIRKILKFQVPFNFVIGGRGTGKTYGALKTIYEDKIRFMLMRRTQAQCDLINKPEFNPFKALASDLNLDIAVKSISKYNSMILEETENDYNIMGYTCALSTIANMRGFDASDVTLLLYDEFIPERHERQLKNEGSAFLNAYETINRNRELQNKNPLQVLALANAFDIGNALFIELGLVGIAERMIHKGNNFYLNKDKGVCVVLINDSLISQQKQDTALYKLAGDTFSKMALNNDFVYNDDSDVEHRSLKEFRLLASIGDEVNIYKHKSNRLYYVSEHRTGTGDFYNPDEVGVKRFIKKYGILIYNAYMNGNIIFESQLTKSILCDYII